MADYNRTVERRVTIRSLTRALLTVVDGFDRATKLEALTDAILSVEEEPTAVVSVSGSVGTAVDSGPTAPTDQPPLTTSVNTPANSHPATTGEEVNLGDAPSPRLTGRVAAGEPKRPQATSGSAEGQTGPTGVVLRVLRTAAKPLLFAQVVDEATKIEPALTRHTIAETLSRISRSKNSPLIRKGIKGKFRYALKTSLSDDGTEETEAGTRGGSRGSDSEIHVRLYEALSQEPSGDYGRLATIVFGDDAEESRKKVRDKLYYLKSRGKLRRTDGKWEVLMQH